MANRFAIVISENPHMVASVMHFLTVASFSLALAVDGFKPTNKQAGPSAHFRFSRYRYRPQSENAALPNL